MLAGIAGGLDHRGQPGEHHPAAHRRRTRHRLSSSSPTGPISTCPTSSSSLGIAMVFLGLIVEAIRVFRAGARDAGLSLVGSGTSSAGPIKLDLVVAEEDCRRAAGRRSGQASGGGQQVSGRGAHSRGCGDGRRGSAAAKSRLLAAGETVTVLLPGEAGERRHRVPDGGAGGVRRRVAAGGGQAGRDGRPPFSRARLGDAGAGAARAMVWPVGRTSAREWCTASTRIRAGLLDRGQDRRRLTGGWWR